MPHTRQPEWTRRHNMGRTVKMTDVVVAGRMAKMRVKVVKPARENAYTRTVKTVGAAMHLAGEAELNTQPRSSYRNALMN